MYYIVVVWYGSIISAMILSRRCAGEEGITQSTIINAFVAVGARRKQSGLFKLAIPSSHVFSTTLSVIWNKK